jgi:hypothetical protein
VLLGGLLLLGGLMLTGAQAGAQSLGVGRGVDHVGMLVRAENFDADSRTWARLGFSETAALTSPAGIKNRLIWFRDLSYLELDTFTDRNPATEPFLDFLEHHEGAKFYGTEVRDAAKAVAFLTGAGYPNVGPLPAGPLTVEATGQEIGLIPLWNSIILTSVVAPDNSLFFLDYNEAQVRQMFVQVPAVAPRPHPNTAQKINTLYLVVADLDAAVDFYRGLGFDVRPLRRPIGYLNARGAEVRYNTQTVDLLVPNGPGLVASFAADRGEGVMGVSLKVRDLDLAHDLIEHNTGLTLPIFTYQGQDRFLIPASGTHGVLVEMAE